MVLRGVLEEVLEGDGLFKNEGNVVVVLVVVVAVGTDDLGVRVMVSLGDCELGAVRGGESSFGVGGAEMVACVDGAASMIRWGGEVVQTGMMGWAGEMGIDWVVDGEVGEAGVRVVVVVVVVVAGSGTCVAGVMAEGAEIEVLDSSY